MDEWNSLPLEVRSACSVDKFKASVIKFVTSCKYYIVFSEFIVIFIIFIYFYMGHATLLQIILMAFFSIKVLVLCSDLFI